MTNIVLPPVTNGNNISTLNDNFRKIQESVNNDLLNLDGGNNVMQQDLDMNGNQLLNIGVDVNNPQSLLTVAAGDSRYYNVSGDTLTGPMSVNGQPISGLAAAVVPTSPVRKQEFDAAVFDTASGLAARLADVNEGDALIGVKQPLTGSVSRTQHSKNSDVVSPQDFAAVGNGVTNDNAAFVALEAAVRHKEIDLGGKTYVVSANHSGNIYYNGYFKVGSTTFKKVQPSAAPTGAGQPDYNFNTSLRYEFASMNGQTVTRGSQAFCFDERNRYLFSLEGDRVNRFPMDGGISVTELDYTQPASAVIGHQGLAIEYLPSNDFRLWTTSAVVGRSACRFIYTPNGPINTTEEFELFTSGSFANSTSCTPTISYDGKYLLAHGTRFGTFTTVIRVFELDKLIAGGPGNYTDKWLYEWETQGVVGDADHPLQGLACDGKTVYCLSGGTGFVITKRLYTFTLDGQLIAKEDNLTIGGTLAAGDGAGTKWEPEGCSIMGGPNGSTTLMVGILSGDTTARRFRIYGVAMAKPSSVEKLQFIGNVKSSIFGIKATGRNYLAIRATDDLNTGCGINLYGNADSGTPGGYGLFVNGSTRQAVTLNGQTTFKADAATAAIAVDSVGSGKTIDFLRNGSLFGYTSISTTDFSVNAVNGSEFRIQTGAGATGTTRCRVVPAGHLQPFVNNTYNLGDASFQWAAFFCVNGTFTGPLRTGQFTLTTLPSASTFNGYLIDVTNATGGPKICRSNGSVWQILNTTTTVS